MTTSSNIKTYLTFYTYKNTQPIICSFISSEPLFYIDQNDEEIDHHEDFLNAYEMDCLLEELEKPSLVNNMIEIDRIDALLLIDENAESLTVDFEENLNDVFDIINKSRFARSHLETAKKNGIKFVQTEQVEAGFYDVRTNTISINTNDNIVNIVKVLMRELRRYYQILNGWIINSMLYEPDDQIFIARVQQADLVSSIVRMAWELKIAGIESVWKNLCHLSSDLCRSFAREASNDFRTINNGVAMAAVFESWFLSERCRMKDREIIQNMLADYNGYVFENIESSKSVTAELIAALGTMPFGKNYLAMHAVIIMDDPIFTEVRDRSNANFLWFIKFERSYKETERSLQTESDLSTHDDRHALYGTQGQDLNYEQERSARIIEISSKLKGRKNPAGKQNFTGGEVIQLSHWVATRR